ELTACGSREIIESRASPRRSPKLPALNTALNRLASFTHRPLEGMGVHSLSRFLAVGLGSLRVIANREYPIMFDRAAPGSRCPFRPGCSSPRKPRPVGTTWLRLAWTGAID